MNPLPVAREGFSEQFRQLRGCSWSKVDGDHRLVGVYIEPQ